MLVLSRKEGESIEFRDLNVCVRVMQLKKSKVQLGIDAPREIQVDRSEMLDRSDKLDCLRGQEAADRLGRQVDRKRIRTSQGESEQRLLDELAKLEVEVMTLAEFVTSKDQDLARQKALVSLERLNGLRNMLKCVSTTHAVPRSISDFMQARQCQAHSTDSDATSANVLSDQRCQELNSEPKPLSQIDCIRQPSVGYFIESDVSGFSGQRTLEAGQA